MTVKKRFTIKVMDYPFRVMISQGLYKIIKKRAEKFDSYSDYVRQLIMNDNNVDEYGTEKK